MGQMKEIWSELLELGPERVRDIEEFFNEQKHLGLMFDDIGRIFNTAVPTLILIKSGARNYTQSTWVSRYNCLEETETQ